MKGFLADTVNTLTAIKFIKVVSRASVLKASKRAAEEASRNSASGDPTVEPEIKTNQDTQEEADRLNIFRLVVVGFKEGVTAEISKVVGTNITDTTLLTTDGQDLKSIDK